MRSIRDVEIKGKRVFLRVDFNVKVKEGVVLGDNRMKSALSTIEYLIDGGAKIILATHLGRPDGKVNLDFSTVPVAKHLSELLDNREVKATDFVTGDEVKQQADELEDGEILFIGNLRFNPGEEDNDENFARELASLADIYVNDAFGVSHRANASVEAITRFLPSYVGFLLESEITSLSLLMKEPLKPFIMVIGGAKIKDKAGILDTLAVKADKVLVGGAVATTFYAANGGEVSESLCDTEMIEECKKILQKYGSKIVLPVDFAKKDMGDGKFNILDIGPETIENYKIDLKSAATIFWNGNMGYTEEEEYAKGTMAMAEVITENPNTKIVAGGDTVDFIEKNGLKSKFSFVSTGGGAAMEFLSGDELPGIKALDQNNL